MRRLDPCLAPAGYSPRRYETLSPAPVLGMGERMTDLLDIQALFANGEQGGYWPADPAYAYEDSAGTIPASVNWVVGLRLGVGTVYQPVTVVNGGFDTDSGWIKGAGWTITDGVASFNNATGNNLYQSASLVAGAAYIVTWTMTKSAGIIRPVFFGGTTVYGAYGTVGNNKQILIAATGNNQLLFEASAGTVCTIDNVTLTRVTPSPAIQATTANKPYLRRTPVSNKTWLDSNTSTGALTATFASALGSACTIATVGADGVTILENQTVSTTYNITPIFGYNGDVMVINRALTAMEKALVTRVLGRNVPMLGSELMPNGTFESGISGWISTDAARGSVSALNGMLFIDGTAGNGAGPAAGYTGLTAPVGQYRIGLDFYDGICQLVNINGKVIYPTLSSASQRRGVVVTTTTSLNSYLYTDGYTSVKVDNFTIKAIL